MSDLHTMNDVVNGLKVVIDQREARIDELQAQVKAYDKALEEVEILYPRIRNIIRRKRAALQENE